MKSKICKVALSFVISLFIVISLLFAYTMLFDGNYVNFEEESLTYEDLFDDLSDMGNLGYVLFDFNGKRIDLVNEPEYNIFKSTSYEPMPKIKGKLLALFVNRSTSVMCIKIDAIDLDADDEKLNKKAEKYYNCESRAINLAYVFKAFGNYYIMVEPRIKGDDGRFVSTMYVCRIKDGKQFSEFDDVTSKEKPNYFFIASYPNVKIEWQVNIYFRMIICFIVVALTTGFYLIMKKKSKILGKH